MAKPKVNKHFEKAKKIHKELEFILLSCKIFEGMEDYSDIVDSLTRALKSINMIKIKSIKDTDN